MLFLSVICGAYNITSFPSLARKSIESVLTQTFSDFELIICNDGSTDETWALLSEYAKGDSRIRLLKNNTNTGLANSLNKCLEIARGKYIARHDLDDISKPERFERQLQFLESHPNIDILGTAVALFNEGGVFDIEYFPPLVKSKDFLYTSPYKHGSVIFRRKALLSAGGYRVCRETLRQEDYDLFMRMHAMGYRGANLDEILYDFKEDRAARKRRKYRYRIGEARVRVRGFSSLGLMPGAIPYALKPIVAGLLPDFVIIWAQKRQRKRKTRVI